MKKELKNPISFSNKIMTSEGEEFELDTMFNRVNKIYSDPDFLKTSMPQNAEMLQVRRMSLELMFKNRAKFTFSNFAKNLLRYLDYIFEDNKCLFLLNDNNYIEKELPFLYDVKWYFYENEEQFSTMVSDISMSIITKFYQDCIFSGDKNNIISQNKIFVDKVLLKAFGELYNSIMELRKEALNIYFNAGYPDMYVSYDIETGMPLLSTISTEKHLSPEGGLLFAEGNIYEDTNNKEIAVYKTGDSIIIEFGEDLESDDKAQVLRQVADMVELESTLDKDGVF